MDLFLLILAITLDFCVIRVPGLHAFILVVLILGYFSFKSFVILNNKFHRRY